MFILSVPDDNAHFDSLEVYSTGCGTTEYALPTVCQDQQSAEEHLRSLGWSGEGIITEVPESEESDV